uniref:Uncharacterized protein n=1 Tax=Nicotiana tabacum TaxID=4097 RepID=A0A1S4BE55_TOBAC|nr:PREDICTED: uncharacterized protein LOC107807259 [Nicotiana tabacum]
MTKAYTVEKFDYHMAEVDRNDKRVKDYLVNVGYERWSRAHSTVNRTLTVTSNIAESINAALKAARELPVLPLLEYIRQLIGRWNVTNQKNAIESFIDLGKKYNTMLMDNLELSHRMKDISFFFSFAVKLQEVIQAGTEQSEIREPLSKIVPSSPLPPYQHFQSHK